MKQTPAERQLHQAEQHLHAAQQALSAEQRAQHQRRAELDDLNRQVTAALRSAGRTGEPVDVTQLRHTIATLEQAISDGTHVEDGRKDAIREAKGEIQRCLLDHYPDFADMLDQAADQLHAEQAAIEQRIEELDAKKEQHIRDYERLQRACPTLTPTHDRISTKTLRPDRRVDEPNRYTIANDLLIRDNWPDWLKDVIRQNRALTNPTALEIA